MKKLLTITFLLLVIFRATAQEITTYRADSIGRKAWVLVATTRFERADSSFYESSQATRFKSRGEIRQHIKSLFAERITADSAAAEIAKQRVVRLKASRAALLAQLNAGGQSAPKEAAAPPTVVTSPAAPANTKGKKKKN
jgi:hypothetical protein